MTSDCTIPISKAFENPTDESPEVEGHGTMRGGVMDQPSDGDERDTEVQGHAARPSHAATADRDGERTGTKSREGNMKNVVQMVVFALMLAGLVGVVAGRVGEAAASNGYESWTAVDSANCTYYWDGYAYTLGLCVRADGGADTYLPVDGTWSFFYSFWNMIDGSITIYYQGQYYNSPVSQVTNTVSDEEVYVDAGVLGGGGTTGGDGSDGIIDAYSVGGVSTNSNSMTLIETIDAVTTADLTDDVLEPTCAWIENGTCVVIGN